MSPFSPIRAVVVLLAYLVGSNLALAQGDCRVDGGSIAFDDGSTRASIIVDGLPDPLDVTVREAPTGPNTAWVVTDEDLDILGLPAAPPFDLNDAGEGTCLIWYLAFADGLEGAEVGANAGDLAGCFDLSNPLTVVRNLPPAGDCAAAAGTLVGSDAPVALDGDGVELSATVGRAPTVPEGFSNVYVLTSGGDLVIEAIGAEPTFTVDAAGTYRIHSLVAALDSTSDDFLDAGIVDFGATTAGQVLDVVAEADICASLDVAGARFRVTDDRPGDDCAVVGGDVVGPDGAKTVFVTDTAGLTFTPALANAEAVAGETQVWVVTADAFADVLIADIIPADDLPLQLQRGVYQIYYVSYDGDAPDGFEIGNSVGAFLFEDCVDAGDPLTLNFTRFGDTPDGDDCAADAGTLAVGDVAGALDSAGNPLFTLTASVATAATVPEGFSNVYVLTSGDDLTIEAIGAEPNFTVAELGTYRIHSFVAALDSTSDDFLDAGVITFGRTTAQVLDVVAEAGICASLDVEGARFDVSDGTPEPGDCDAFAGTLEPVEADLAIAGVGVRLETRVGEAPVVPEGYEVIYVLTTSEHLVIQNFNTEPTFFVQDPNVYRIHTFVAELSDSSDVDFVDAGVVEFGKTNAFDLLTLLAEGGICADLDPQGAVFNATRAEGAGLAARTRQEGPGGDLRVTLTPTGADLGAVEVLLSDPTGRRVSSLRLGEFEVATTVTLPIAGQAEGMYVVSVHSVRGVSSSAVLVQ